MLVRRVNFKTRTCLLRPISHHQHHGGDEESDDVLSLDDDGGGGGWEASGPSCGATPGTDQPADQPISQSTWTAGRLL